MGFSTAREECLRRYTQRVEVMLRGWLNGSGDDEGCE